MTVGLPQIITGAASQTAPTPKPDSVKNENAEDIGRRFEELLWAEMLSGSGFEEALTMNGGDAASGFSRFVIEQIAADLALKHPLGLSDAAGIDAMNKGLGKIPGDASSLEIKA